MCWSLLPFIAVVPVGGSWVLLIVEESGISLGFGTMKFIIEYFLSLNINFPLPNVDKLVNKSHTCVRFTFLLYAPS